MLKLLVWANIAVIIVIAVASGVPGESVGIAWILGCIVVTRRLYLSWPHRGWRRLALVLSIVFAAFPLYLGIEIWGGHMDREERFAAVLVAATSVLGGFLLILGVRRTALWVREGFANPRAEHELASKIRKEEQSE